MPKPRANTHQPHHCLSWCKARGMTSSDNSVETPMAEHGEETYTTADSNDYAAHKDGFA